LSRFATGFAADLGLTSSQVEAIQQVVMREQHTLEPAVSELRTTRENPLAISSEQVSQKQVNSLGDGSKSDDTARVRDQVSQARASGTTLAAI